MNQTQLKEWRLSMDPPLSHVEAAIGLQVKPSTYYNWETGKSKAPAYLAVLIKDYEQRRAEMFKQLLREERCLVTSNQHVKYVVCRLVSMSPTHYPYRQAFLVLPIKHPSKVENDLKKFEKSLQKQGLMFEVHFVSVHHTYEEATRCQDQAIETYNKTGMTDV